MARNRNNATGLSFQEAAEQALAEEEFTDDSTSAVTDDADLDGSTEGEHPVSDDNAIDEEEDRGVLADLDDSDPNDDGGTLSEENSFLEIDGKQITREEARKGYLRHEDYTKKTQELADMRKTYEKAIALWDALQDDPVGTVRQLAAKVNTGQPLVARESNQSHSEEDLDTIVERKLQERLENDPRLQAFEEDRARQAVTKVFDRIEQSNDVKLSKQDKLLILQRAQDLGTTDLEFVFAGLLKQAEARRAQRENLKSVAPTKGRRTDAFDEAEDIDGPIESFADAVKAAQRELQLEVV